jgi:hypothetical protein
MHSRTCWSCSWADAPRLKFFFIDVGDYSPVTVPASVRSGGAGGTMTVVAIPIRPAAEEHSRDTAALPLSGAAAYRTLDVISHP